MDNKTFKSQERTKVKGIGVGRVNIYAADIWGVKSLWFNGLKLSSENLWEFCQLLLIKPKASNMWFKIYM